MLLTTATVVNINKILKSVMVFKMSTAGNDAPCLMAAITTHSSGAL